MPYWRRPGQLAALIGLSAATYGIGGLVFHALRGGRRYCGGCGAKWGDGKVWSSTVPSWFLERKGIWRVVHFGFPAVMLSGVVDATVGIVNGDLSAVVRELGKVALFGMLFASWSRELADRDLCQGQAQRRNVLLLADRRGGLLTVTEVAMELELGLDEAEELMMDMDDGFRVRADVGGDGVIRYEFPEVLHRARLRASAKPGKIGRGRSKPGVQSADQC